MLDQINQNKIEFRSNKIHLELDKKFISEYS